MMRTLLLLLMLFALPAAAADLELGIRHLGTTHVGEMQFEGGELDIAASRGFAATAELFPSPRYSAHLAGTFINPATILVPAEGALIDLGTLGIDSYSLSGRYHFRLHSRWKPFVGIGGAYVLLGNLEDRFGDDIEIRYENQVTWLVEGGMRFAFWRDVTLDAALTYMPLEADPKFMRNDSATVLPGTFSLDPVTLSVGASWRF